MAFNISVLVELLILILSVLLNLSIFTKTSLPFSKLFFTSFVTSTNSVQFISAKSEIVYSLLFLLASSFKTICIVEVSKLSLIVALHIILLSYEFALTFVLLKEIITIANNARLNTINIFFYIFISFSPYFLIFYLLEEIISGTFISENMNLSLGNLKPTTLVTLSTKYKFEIVFFIIIAFVIFFSDNVMQ